MTKRKAAPGQFIDRNEKLNKSQVTPNIIDGLDAIPCVRHWKSREKLFSYKLVVREDKKLQNCQLLDSCVLANGIVVIKLPDDDIPKIQHVEIIGNDWGCDSLSGRFKKGAMVIKSGRNILKATYIDGSEVTYKTPVGGQVLELEKHFRNQIKLRMGTIKPDQSQETSDREAKQARISTEDSSTSSSETLVDSNSPSPPPLTHPPPPSPQVNNLILSTSTSGLLSSQYICILYPDTLIPSIEGPFQSSEQLYSEYTRKQTLRFQGGCFQWIQSGGVHCVKGNQCKFKHSNISSSSFSSTSSSSSSSVSTDTVEAKEVKTTPVSSSDSFLLDPSSLSPSSLSPSSDSSSSSHSE